MAQLRLNFPRGARIPGQRIRPYARGAKAYINYNRTPQLVSHIIQQAQTNIDQIALEAEELLKTDLATRDWASGSHHSLDTGASANSVYHVLGNGNTNYDETAANFVSLASRDVIYGGRPLAEIVFAPLSPEIKPGRYSSIMASLSLILAFWEYGHHNKLTGNYESAPIISYNVAQVRQLFRQRFGG